MSCQHHSPSEEEARNRMLQEFLGKSEPRFPQGKISDNDEGEISFAVAADLNRKVVIIRFAKPVDWIGLNAEAIRNLANLLLEKAEQIDPTRPTLT